MSRGKPMTRGLFVALAACALAALAYGVSLLVELRAATAPATPSAFVQASWSVYRFGPGHQFHTGTLKLDCKACHRTEPDGQFDPPGPAPCVSCHEKQAQIEHAMVALDAHGKRVGAGVGEGQVADCIRCHGFGPDPHKQASDCLSCHAHAHGDTPAIVTHAENACRDCHDVHENRITPMACTQCHALSLTHAHAAAPVEEQCLGCHRAHDRASGALDRCADCHAPGAEKPIPASATPEGHTCTGCHTPHAFGKNQVKDCASCHSDVHTLEGKGHRECTSCHAPHAVRESVQTNVCVGCHSALTLKHGSSIDPAQACISCHAPHPQPTSARQAGAAHTGLAHGLASCASCHASVAQNQDHAHAGGLTCTSCHKPHDFALEAGKAACAACHAQQIKLVQPNAGHASCTGCHQNVPHGTDLSPGPCTSCHQDVPANKGHQNCTACHEPHAGTQNGKSCSSCHGKESGALLHPAHKVSCLSCHDQHSGKLQKGGADCSGCHQRASLPGLHEVREHAALCTNCHKPHEPSLPGGRETCLSCHKDRRDHQPEAPRCEGCHQFEAARRGSGR